jgi:hypothetical protein
MTKEHLDVLLKAAKAEKSKDGWRELATGREMTLYVATGGASLTVGRISGVKEGATLLEARTIKGEHYVLAMEDVFAGSVDESSEKPRKAGFV